MLGDLCNQESFLSNLNGLLDDEKLTNENDEIARREKVQNRLSETFFHHDWDQSRRGYDALGSYKHRIIFSRENTNMES